jgi:hypothetical protein
MRWQLRGESARLTRLAVVLAAMAGISALVGVVLVAGSAPDGARREIGKWCMQLALVFAGTGVVSVVVRQSELSRARREAWADLLHELVGAHDEAQMASRLLSAHATAKTYSEQVAALTAVRGTLRRLSSAPGVYEDTDLHESLLAMRRYLKDVVKEHQAKYLPTARQRRLDEEVLSFRLRRLAQSEESALPTLPPNLPSRFPLAERCRTPPSSRDSMSSGQASRRAPSDVHTRRRSPSCNETPGYLCQRRRHH